MPGLSYTIGGAVLTDLHIPNPGAQCASFLRI